MRHRRLLVLPVLLAAGVFVWARWPGGGDLVEGPASTPPPAASPTAALPPESPEPAGPEQDCVVEIEVVDEAGAALPDASLGVRAGDRVVRPLSPLTESPASVVVPERAELGLEAARSGYEPVARTFGLARTWAGKCIHLALRRARSLPVRVVDDAADPVEGAEVRIVPPPREFGLPPGSPGGRWPRTDAEGRAEVNLSWFADDWRVVAVTGARCGAIDVADAKAGSPVVLGIRDALHFTVVSPDGTSAANAAISLSRYSRVFATLTADANGEAWLSPAPRSLMRVNATTSRGSGGAMASPPWREVRIDLTARAPFPVRVIDDSGRRVAGAEVLLFELPRRPGDEPSVRTLADAEGRALVPCARSVRDQAPNSCSLVVRARGYGAVSRRVVPIPLSEGELVELSRARRISARVVRDGAPVVGVPVRIGVESPDRDWLEDPSLLNELHSPAATDGSGRVEFHVARTDTIELVTGSPGAGWARAEIPPGEEDVEVDLVLEPARTVLVEVRDDAGEPVADAAVTPYVRGLRASRIRGDVAAASAVVTGRDGSATVRIPSGGDVALAVRASGFAPRHPTIEAGVDRAVFALHPMAEIVGRVVPPPGFPVRIVARIDFREREAIRKETSMGIGVEERVYVGNDGRFVLSPLLAGHRYRLSFEGLKLTPQGEVGEVVAPGEIEVPWEGQNLAEVTLRLATGGVRSRTLQTVRLWYAGEGGKTVCRVGTAFPDSKGEATIRVPREILALQVRPDGAWPTTVLVRGQPPETVEVNTRSTAAEVRLVFPDGRPAAGAHITLSAPTEIVVGEDRTPIEPGANLATTDKDGRARVIVPPDGGRVLLTVRIGGRVVSEERKIAPGDTVEWTLPGDPPPPDGGGK